MSRFETDEYYHIYNRGVDRRKIFMNKSDYQRFLFILHLFNDLTPSFHIERKISSTARTFVRNPISDNLGNIDGRESLVEIVEYCLMPNHFHILFKQNVDEGISKIMQKVGIGYTHYFNKKYDRNGVLFQGKTKSKHVDSDAYLMWLKRYIHLNPVEVIEPSWNSKGLGNLNDLVDRLNKYPWVSCRDYGGYISSFETDLVSLSAKLEWD